MPKKYRFKSEEGHKIYEGVDSNDVVDLNAEL